MVPKSMSGDREESSVVRALVMGAGHFLLFHRIPMWPWANQEVPQLLSI